MKATFFLVFTRSGKLLGKYGKYNTGLDDKTPHDVALVQAAFDEGLYPKNLRAFECDENGMLL